MQTELFTVEASTHGPYEALPVDGTWSPYEPISVSRAVAERIAEDLNILDAGCGMTAAWDGPVLTFTWDETYDGDGGALPVRPGDDGRYLIGRLWAWERRALAPLPSGE
ncbi:hypothetical protein [Streptomyces globisporus]